MASPSVAHAELLSPRLNPRLKSAKEQLAGDFRSAEPFPHLVIPDILAPDIARQLLDDSVSDVDAFMQTPDFVSFLSDITGIPDLVYDREYDVDGATLYTHVDFNYNPQDCPLRLNLILYLDPGWKTEWGASLELHTNPGRPDSDTATVVPTKFNQAVLFETSEHSWQGFSQVRLREHRKQLSGKPFAVYLYTTEHPDDQTDERIDLQGYAVQTTAPSGRWSDTWVSSDFSMEFTAIRPVRGLVLEIAVPREMDSDQVLYIHAGDWIGTEALCQGESRAVRLPISVEAGETSKVEIHANATWSPGGADTRALAYRIVSAQLEH